MTCMVIQIAIPGVHFTRFAREGYHRRVGFHAPARRQLLDAQWL